MTQQTKPFIVANVRDIIDGWEHFDPEGYSFSKMVEKLNEKASECYQQEVAKEREKAKKLVHALRMCIGALKGLDATDYVAYTAGKVALIDYQNEIEPETTGNQTAC